MCQVRGLFGPDSELLLQLAGQALAETYSSLEWQLGRVAASGRLQMPGGDGALQGVAGHLPVGGPLAAGNGHQPAGRNLDVVVARYLCGGLVALRLEQGAEPCPGGQHILARELAVEVAAEVVQ